MEQLSPDVWTFRGSHRIGGVIEVGTHATLVRRPSGRFLLLDSIAFDERQRADLMRLTDGGRGVEAVLNLHPFHTLHCAAARALFPDARLIGTARHHARQPELGWEPGLIEDAATWGEWADTLDFSVPAGVDFISANEHVHFASVLARHARSGVVHVDDTFNLLALPGPLKALTPNPKLRLHPTLGKALRQEPGAADAFAAWARGLAEAWSDTRVVAAAHSTIRRLAPGDWRREVLTALAAVEETLTRHRDRRR